MLNNNEEGTRALDELMNAFKDDAPKQVLMRGIEIMANVLYSIDAITNQFLSIVLNETTKEVIISRIKEEFPKAISATSSFGILAALFGSDSVFIRNPIIRTSFVETAQYCLEHGHFMNSKTKEQI
jgi:hypothetical protein